jgi:hypothetical protein
MMLGARLTFGIYRKKWYLALAFGVFSGLVSCITPMVIFLPRAEVESCQA